MVGSIKIEDQSAVKKLHPHKLMLWIAIGSMTMTFAALTSAYLVKKAHGNWMDFRLPTEFLYSTLVVLASSLTMHLALSFAKKKEKSKYLSFMFATIALGIGFLMCQLAGYKALVNMGIYLSDNTTASGSFLYVISFAHAAHLIGGVAFLIIMFFKGVFSKTFFENTLGVELTSIFWHYVGVLWVYLFIFFSINY